MSENDAKKNKHRFKDIEKTSRESNEQQVLTVAAFALQLFRGWQQQEVCRHMFSQVELKQL